MANTIRRGPGDTAYRVAPAAGVTNGVPTIVGAEFLLPLATAASGATFPCVVANGCEIRCAIATGHTFANQRAYFNPTSGEMEDTDSASNVLVGRYVEAAQSGYGWFAIDGVTLASATGDLANKIDKVTGIAGKVPKMTAAGGVEDGGILAADVVTKVAPAAAHSVAGLTAAGFLEDTTILTADLQVATVPAIAGNLAGLDAAGKLTDSGVAGSGFIAALPAAVAGNIPAFAAGGATVTDSGVAATDVQVLAVPAAAGNVATLSALGAVQDSTIASANLQVLAVPTAAGNVATLDAAGAVQDSTIASANLQVLAVPGAGHNLCSLTAAGAVEDAGYPRDAIPVANVNTGAAGAGIPMLGDGAGGSTFAAVDSAGIAAGSIDPLHLAAPATVGTISVAGNRIILNVEAAADPIDFDLSTNPQTNRAFRIRNVAAYCTAANAGGTAQLQDAGGNAISSVMAMAVEGDLSWTTSVTVAERDVVAGSTLRVDKNAAGDDGEVWIDVDWQ